jgi:hypothetical protein
MHLRPLATALSIHPEAHTIPRQPLTLRDEVLRERITTCQDPDAPGNFIAKSGPVYHNSEQHRLLPGVAKARIDRVGTPALLQSISPPLSCCHTQYALPLCEIRVVQTSSLRSGSVSKCFRTGILVFRHQAT